MSGTRNREYTSGPAAAAKYHAHTGEQNGRWTRVAIEPPDRQPDSRERIDDQELSPPDRRQPPGRACAEQGRGVLPLGPEHPYEALAAEREIEPGMGPQYLGGFRAEPLGLLPQRPCRRSLREVRLPAGPYRFHRLALHAGSHDDRAMKVQVERTDRAERGDTERRDIAHDPRAHDGEEHEIHDQDVPRVPRGWDPAPRSRLRSPPRG